jgi:hypothetical protein
MLSATIVSTKDEIAAIHHLNQLNLKQNLSVNEQHQEGFVTWLYSLELLEQIHELSPSVIVKDGQTLAGYALTTPIEARDFHPDLNDMFENLKQVTYNGHPLFSYSFYCMGQICIAKEYRVKGVVNLLYNKHKELYSNDYDFILTEISTKNYRSLIAHKKVGFKSIYNHTDATDNWDVVLWDWK